MLKTQWGDKRIDTAEGRTNELEDVSEDDMYMIPTKKADKIHERI